MAPSCRPWLCTWPCRASLPASTFSSNSWATWRSWRVMPSLSWMPGNPREAWAEAPSSCLCFKALRVPENKTTCSPPALSHLLSGHLCLAGSLTTSLLVLTCSPLPCPYRHPACFDLPEISPPTHRLGMEEHPYSSRLKKIGELLDQASVTREEVVSELGNGIAAFESVPTAIYCFLRCMEPDPEIPSAFNSLQRTLIYSISLGGDTDTIATMAGAIAGAYYGMDQVPESWQQSCEGYEETDILAQSLHRVFQKSL
uniref:ADP-ribosylhydrolase ARH3 n=1 Tax=Macaca fascicularis TaxID=9541 RepID=A0A7N9D3L2_MACFA